MRIGYKKKNLNKMILELYRIYSSQSFVSLLSLFTTWQMIWKKERRFVHISFLNIFLSKLSMFSFVYIYIYFGSLGFPIYRCMDWINIPPSSFLFFFNTLTKKSSVPFIFHAMDLILDSSFSLVILKYTWAWRQILKLYLNIC